MKFPDDSDFYQKASSGDPGSLVLVSPSVKWVCYLVLGKFAFILLNKGHWKGQRRLDQCVHSLLRSSSKVKKGAGTLGRSHWMMWAWEKATALKNGSNPTTSNGLPRSSLLSSHPHLLSSPPSYQARRRVVSGSGESLGGDPRLAGLLLCNLSEQWHSPWSKGRL